ncbi:MAG: cupin domain-containing protein [Chitinophagaceae bacterium]
MKRKSFILSTLAAVSLPALPSLAGISDRPKKGFKVEAGKSRFNDSITTDPGNPGGVHDGKVSGKDTEGDLYIFEASRKTKGGPDRHRHAASDEWFYILEGEYVFKAGDEELHLKAGDSIFVPRTIYHQFALVSEEPGKMIGIIQPVGRMETFFHERSKT